MSDPVEKVIKKFEFHPRTLVIENRIDKIVSRNFFCFNEVTKADVMIEINYINNKKANPFHKIP